MKNYTNWQFMNMNAFTATLIIMICCFTYKSQAQQPSFPGSEGAGGGAIGGRGGQVIYVTNLNDSGSGSLRAAIAQSGPRTVVFRVGGTINLQSPLDIVHPYITIAGQTAPGGGIFIKNNYIALYTGVHDVIIQYITLRLGSAAGFSGQGGDCISIGDGAHEIIVDHCSFGWSNDENVGIWSDNGPVYNITFSNNIIAEALNYDHVGSGFIVGSNVDSDDIVGISVLKNAFLHNYNRNPLLKCGDGQIINNIVYNADKYTTMIAGGIQIDIANNLYKQGPDSDSRYAVLARPHDGTPNTGAYGNPSVYLEGNIGQYGETAWGQLIELTHVDHWGFPGNPPTRTSLDISYKRSSKMTASYYTDFPVQEIPTANLENAILSHVGASKKINSQGSIVSNRNSVDTRLINEYNNGTGTNPSTEADVGGFPTISNGTPYPDNDGDGMSNAWEDSYGLNKNSASDRNGDLDGDGFTNLEEFLSGGVPTSSQSYQAENAVISQTSIDSDNTGYTGTGFANYDNLIGSYVEWTVNVPTAGSKILKFRYANGASQNRQMKITVNGTVVDSGLSFNGTGSWTTWSNRNKTVTLEQGINIIRATATTANGGPNVDYLEVASSGGSRNVDEDLDQVSNDPFVIYPNPSIDNVITISSGKEGGHLVVYNLQGKVISKAKVEPESKTKLKLDKGIYFAKFNYSNNSVVRKIIIQ